MTTIAQLYKDRCYTTPEGKSVPKYWQPPKIERKPHTLYGNADRLCGHSWGVHECVMRMLALGLELEIPVGECITAHLAKEERVDLQLLLKSNAADEACHQRGFELAVEAYPLTDDIKASVKELADKWRDLFDRYPSILLAASLEIGVFLPALGAMRLFGGSSLALMADGIARDEYRHASINRALCEAHGCSFDDTIELCTQTVRALFAGLNIPREILGIAIDAEFFVNASENLLRTGAARELDDVVTYSNHLLPFEIGNDRLY